MQEITNAYVNMFGGDTIMHALHYLSRQSDATAHFIYRLISLCTQQEADLSAVSVMVGAKW